ncbi:MAG TPA: TetR/AcrR family transcriptional regulator [Euzebyales bacterium]|nr:TetR/AcrR family transcriptional regulator [Euzebyales bacterium]
MPQHLKADASKVTVYRHFADKEGLFVAVVESAIEEAEARSRWMVDGSPTARIWPRNCVPSPGSTWPSSPSRTWCGCCAC